MAAHPVPELRITPANDAPVRAAGDHVLYWMNATRRARYNFALDRAIARAVELGKPLIVLEALRCGYRWASDRLHGFVVDGMADNRAAFQGSAVRYYPYVEDRVGAGRGLVAALARRACVVVTDDFPCFFLPRMVAAAARKIPVLVEKVDSNGPAPDASARRPRILPGGRLAPLAPEEHRAAPRAIAAPAPARRCRSAASTAGARGHDALAGRVEGAAARGGRRFGCAAHRSQCCAGRGHDGRCGGRRQAGCACFLRDGLARYDEDRNHPDRDGGSRLSPWLHFGHISVHEVFAELARREQWTVDALGSRADGGRDGFWNMSGPAESFLDELITWRELGLNMCSRRADYDRYESLPQWAQQTLAEHENDQRPHLYTFDELEEARTHDEIWNAAQTQLRRDGRIHNYLRMLWGKKVLEWSPSPRDALAILIELNNRYALDGRDPNSYSGIFWVFGRYDRAWGPERPVFGKIRYMTSGSTRRKVQLGNYLASYCQSSAG